MSAAPIELSEAEAAWLVQIICCTNEHQPNRLSEISIWADLDDGDVSSLFDRLRSLQRDFAERRSEYFYDPAESK